MEGCSNMATLITPESGTDWDRVDLFLAGGISNCPDWQSEVIKMLSETDLSIANPRRPYGLEKTGDAAAKQIAWEHEMLRLPCSGFLLGRYSRLLCLNLVGR